jgi:hypothetical protein
MKNKRTPKLLPATLVLAAMLISACSPVFNEMQSARTVGAGRVEATGNFSSVNYASDGESEQIQNQAGLQMAYGVSDKVDLRARYERIWSEDLDEGVNVWGIGPKFSLIEKRIAFYMPIGNAIGDYDDNWQLHPTFLITIPLAKDQVEFTIAPKYLLTFCSDCDDGLAINFGLALGQLSNWALRLEYGLLYNTQEFGDGHYNHLSLGVSCVFGKGKE